MRTFAIAVILAVAIVAVAAGTYSNGDAVARLSAAGISVRSSGGCSNRNNPSCTSLDGIHSECIDGASGVITLKRASGCAITIVGHAAGAKSHGNGWKLDVAMSSCLTSYITSKFTSIGGGKWRAGSGNVYYNEGNHWDITFA